MSVDRKKKLRTEFMTWLYDVTDGDETVFADTATFHGQSGVEAHELGSAIQYLEGQGLVTPLWTMGGDFPSNVRISHRGVVEVETARAHPDDPTEHFAPMNVTTIHGDVIGSQLQQGSPGATQHGNFPVDARQQVADFSRAVRESLPELGLDDETRQRTQRDLDMIDAELASEPRPGVVREIVNSVRTAAEGAAGSIAAAGILALPLPF